MEQESRLKLLEKKHASMKEEIKQLKALNSKLVSRLNTLSIEVFSPNQEKAVGYSSAPTNSRSIAELIEFLSQKLEELSSNSPLNTVRDSEILSELGRVCGLTVSENMRIFKALQSLSDSLAPDQQTFELDFELVSSIFSLLNGDESWLQLSKPKKSFISKFASKRAYELQATFEAGDSKSRCTFPGVEIRSFSVVPLKKGFFEMTGSVERFVANVISKLKSGNLVSEIPKKLGELQVDINQPEQEELIRLFDQNRFDLLFHSNFERFFKSVSDSEYIGKNNRFFSLLRNLSESMTSLQKFSVCYELDQMIAEEEFIKFKRSLNYPKIQAMRSLLSDERMISLIKSPSSEYELFSAKLTSIDELHFLSIVKSLLDGIGSKDTDLHEWMSSHSSDVLALFDSENFRFEFETLAESSSSSDLLRLFQQKDEESILTTEERLFDLLNFDYKSWVAVKVFVSLFRDFSQKKSKDHFRSLLLSSKHMAAFTNDLLIERILREETHLSDNCMRLKASSLWELFLAFDPRCEKYENFINSAFALEFKDSFGGDLADDLDYRCRTFRIETLFFSRLKKETESLGELGMKMLKIAANSESKITSFQNFFRVFPDKTDLFHVYKHCFIGGRLCFNLKKIMKRKREDFSAENISKLIRSSNKKVITLWLSTPNIFDELLRDFTIPFFYKSLVYDFCMQKKTSEKYTSFEEKYLRTLINSIKPEKEKSITQFLLDSFSTKSFSSLGGFLNSRSELNSAYSKASEIFPDKNSRVEKFVRHLPFSIALSEGLSFRLRLAISDAQEFGSSVVFEGSKDASHASMIASIVHQNSDSLSDFFKILFSSKTPMEYLAFVSRPRLYDTLNPVTRRNLVESMKKDSILAFPVEILKVLRNLEIDERLVALAEFEVQKISFIEQMRSAINFYSKSEELENFACDMVEGIIQDVWLVELTN